MGFWVTLKNMFFKVIGTLKNKIFKVFENLVFKVSEHLISVHFIRAISWDEHYHS